MKTPDPRWFCCRPPEMFWCRLDHANHVFLQSHYVRWICDQHDRQITKEHQ